MRTRRHPAILFFVLATLFLVTTASLAQEDGAAGDTTGTEVEQEVEPTDEEKAAVAIQTMDARMDSILALVTQAKTAKDEDLQLLRVQAGRHVAVMEDAESDFIGFQAKIDSTLAKPLTKRFHDYLFTKYDIYDQAVNGWHKEIEYLRGLRSSASDNEVGQIESQIGAARSRLDGYMESMARIISTAGDQGMDVASIQERFDGYLINRADNLLGRLQVAIDSRDDLKNRIRSREKAKEGEEAISPLRIRLQFAETRVKGVAASLSATADLLAERKLDTAEYRQAVIKSTGEISDRVLDPAVFLGLASDFSNALADWFKDNGPTILLKILLIILSIFLTRLIFRLVWWLMRLVRLIKLTRLMIQLGNSLVAPIATFVGLFTGLWVIGADPTTLLTGAGVAGVIIGFALQDSLANLAAGFFILATRPFDIDDVIRTGTVVGTVKAMWIANTTVVTFDGRRLLIPNRKIWADIIENRSVEPNRRVDITVRVGFDEDIDRAIAILHDLVTNEEHVLKYPEPSIFVGKWADSWVDIEVRPWARNQHWWDMYTNLPRLVALRFQEEGIEIPSPRVAMTGLPEDPQAPTEKS